MSTATMTTATRKTSRSFGSGFHSPIPSHIDVYAVFGHFRRLSLLRDYDRFTLRDCRGQRRPRTAGDATYGPFQVWGRRVSPIDGSCEWQRVACFDHPGDARAFKRLADEQ